MSIETKIKTKEQELKKGWWSKQFDKVKNWLKKKFTNTIKILTKKRTLKNKILRYILTALFLLLVDSYVLGVLYIQTKERLIVHIVSVSEAEESTPAPVSLDVADAVGSRNAKGEVSSPNIADKIGEFSAYTARIEETDGNPNIMASGKKVYNGAIACPSKYKFGTKISVQGKVYTCEDRMNARYRDKENFDIFFESYDEALKFGRKQLNYKIL